MAALYGGSHDGRKNITPNYGCDNMPRVSIVRYKVSMASQDQRILDLLAIKLIWHLVSLINQLSYQSTTPDPTNNRSRTQKALMKSRSPVHHLNRNWAFSTMSIFNKLICPSIDCVCYHLAGDELFPVNPRAVASPPKMNHRPEVKCMPAVTIKQLYSFVMLKDDFRWAITTN